MPTVELRFAPSAEHVRTARLVAAAVARRMGVDPVRLDEVRLAVGEACARAVRRCQAGGVHRAVELGIDDVGVVLHATVTDWGDGGGSAEDDVAMALVKELADTVSVEAGPGGVGGTVRLAWNLGL